MGISNNVKNEQLDYAIQECDLGFVLIAASKKGIRALYLHDDRNSLLEALQQSFPSVQLTNNPDAIKHFMTEILQLLQNPSRKMNLPLDVHGTVFQRKVWQVLSNIPVGSTVSYLDVAKKIAAPKAVRAVANACASNEISLLIPCHRVVKSDGKVSGYRWGVQRKKELLRREQQTR